MLGLGLERSTYMIVQILEYHKKIKAMNLFYNNNIIIIIIF